MLFDGMYCRSANGFLACCQYVTFAQAFVIRVGERHSYKINIMANASGEAWTLC